MLWPNEDLSLNDAMQRSAKDLPATFGDTFDAAWHDAQLFGSSVAQGNAQMAGLESYIDDVKQISGEDISKEVYSRIDLQQAAQDAVAKIRQTRPDLQIPDLTDDELNRRAVAASGEAHQAAEDMAGREKTFGGKIGGILGSMAAGAADPINLVGLAVAPEAELGVLGTAAAWGAFGTGSQAVNELANINFRNQVVPNYSASGQPGFNILGAGASGAALGALFKGMGAAWQRVKTGEWPRSIRDAGNIVESEANTQGSNVLPGAEGEAMHRQALGDAIDQIVAGGPVSVDTPSVEPLIDAAMEQRQTAATAVGEARAARAAPTEELPFEATAQEAKAEQETGSLADHLQGFGVAKEDAADLADRVMAAKSDDEARAILSEALARPGTIADTIPSVSAIVKAERAAQFYEETPSRAVIDQLAPEAQAATFADPNHDTALLTDLERLRDTGQGGMIPMGMENGEPKYQLLDAAIQDAHNDRDAAEQLEACINPPVEEAAE